MALMDEILGTGGIDAAGIGARFGLTPEQSQSAMGSLLPAVLGGFQKKADTGELAPVTEAANGIGQPDTASGNDILGHIFGGKDVSRQVADHASGQSGVSSEILKAMLPIVAAMVAKHFAANGGGAGAQGGLGGMLGSILGGAGGGALGGIFGGGTTTGGNPLDAILGRMR